jgi:hypothetical protein
MSGFNDGLRINRIDRFPKTSTLYTQGEITVRQLIGSEFRYCVAQMPANPKQEKPGRSGRAFVLSRSRS